VSPIAVIHEARFVPFDDDTRLLFATSFDGPWESYMVDFASKPLKLFDAIFQHVEGYEGLPDLEAVRAFILSAQKTAGGYARNHGGTVKEIRKAERPCTPLRRSPLGPVHPRRPGGAEDHRDRAVGVPRSLGDLPGRQERPEPGDRS